MNYMFKDAEKFNSDISLWDVTSLKFAAHMFEDASDFNQDLSPWNVRNLGHAYAMFKGAGSFDQTLCWDLSHRKLPFSFLLLLLDVIDGIDLHAPIVPSPYR